MASMTARASSSAATIGPVAVALANRDVIVRDLTLRTPTLDDVFLELTGTRIHKGEAGYDETEEVNQ